MLFEVAKGACRVLEEPKRDVSGQPFEIRKLTTTGEEMLGGQAVGPLGVPIAHLVPGKGPPPVGPGLRLTERLGTGRGFFQKLLRAVGQAAADTPFETVVRQPGGGLLFGRQGRDHLVHAGGAALKRDPGFCQSLGIRIHEVEHPSGVLMRALPEHRIEARSVVRAQQRGMVFEKAGLLLRIHGHGAPGQDKVRLCLSGLIGTQKGGGMGQNAHRCLRRHLGKERQHILIRGIFKRRFSLAAQVRLARPVGPAVKKRAGLRIGTAPGPQAMPFDDVGGNLTVPRGNPRGVLPTARAHRVQRPAKRSRPLLRGGGNGEGRRKKQCR